ncbi:LysR family transcriptional regulator [Rhodococcus sp. NPDC059234]|uniref:LysR family transcriptional regulator n=1 Tax=Rhodococcus sp. NPDC059234 TaxID=3346781 RepID=UPI00366D2210
MLGTDLSLRALHALLTVVDEGHFGRAAERLFVTTPALSQQIRRLETQLGVRLLERASHPIELTEAGQVFVPQAREVLRTADRAVNLLVALERRQSRQVRIGFINGAAGRLGRAALDSLHSPFELVHIDWSEQLSAVESGKVDAAFVRPPLPEANDLLFDLIGQESRVAVLPRSHPLGDRSTIEIADLDGEVHVRSDAGGEQWLRWWSVDPRPSGAAVSYGPYVRSMDELLEVVADGRAVAITAATIAEYYTRADVRFVPVSDIEPCTVELCTRAGDTHPGVVELRRAVAG